MILFFNLLLLYEYLLCAGFILSIDDIIKPSPWHVILGRWLLHIGVSGLAIGFILGLAVGDLTYQLCFIVSIALIPLGVIKAFLWQMARYRQAKTELI